MIRKIPDLFLAVQCSADLKDDFRILKGDACMSYEPIITSVGTCFPLPSSWDIFINPYCMPNHTSHVYSHLILNIEKCFKKTRGWAFSKLGRRDQHKNRIAGEYSSPRRPVLIQNMVFPLRDSAVRWSCQLLVYKTECSPIGSNANSAE